MLVVLLIVPIQTFRVQSCHLTSLRKIGGRGRSRNRNEMSDDDEDETLRSWLTLYYQISII